MLMGAKPQKGATLMHIRFHLPKDFYQLIKRKAKRLSIGAKGRMNTLTVCQALLEVGRRQCGRS